MFGKIVKGYKEAKVKFMPGDKALYKRTNEIVVVIEHILPNAVTILLNRRSKAYTEDYGYMEYWPHSAYQSYMQGTIEISVDIDQLDKLPNSTIADLLYD